jgi:diguanylate cyclase (GGDEF)-like protein
VRWTRRLLRRTPAVGQWPLWSLPDWLVSYVLVTAALDLAGIGAAASGTTIRGHDLALSGLLLGCTALSVEFTRKAGEQAGMIKDVHGIWELPVAILLPPLYALVVPIVRVGLTQWRVRRAPPHRRVFTGAAVSLSYGAASVTFHGLSGLVPQDAGGALGRGMLWTLLVLVSVLVKSVLNKVMIMTAVKGSEPATSIRAQLFGGEPLYNDVAEVCIGVLVTYGVAGNPLLALVALPAVTLLQRSLRHVQLLNDSRTDAKTGLLNASAWEAEATAEVLRAVRTRSPLAVAMLDIDRFKQVNDTYGHLAGDQVLKEIAHTLRAMLREYDLAGRFGGEEFALLLPQTGAADAFRIAERLRASVAGLTIIAPGQAGGERVHVTVSIGVAALDGGSQRKLAELVAVADAALYRAKDSGRDQVQMISTSRGLSVACGAAAALPARGASGGGTDGAGQGTAREAASASRSRGEPPGQYRRARTS